MAVPMTSDSIRIEVYQVAGNHGCNASSTPSTNHLMFDAGGCRVTETWTVSPGAPHEHMLTGGQAATGGIYYLPYEDNKIYSMRLPGNPPLGCRKFLTANLSGCRVYVDTILGSNDILVYHANTKQFGSPPGSPANAQSVQASNILSGLHTTAKTDYRGLIPSVSPIDGDELIKYDYCMPGETEALRKRGQGRTATAPVWDPIAAKTVYTPGQPAEFLGGTTVCGFFTNHWTFYYQTWGYISYDRPGGAGVVIKSLLTGHWNRVHKLRTQGTTSSTKLKVLEAQQFA
jgi:hypothetical protein